MSAHNAESTPVEVATRFYEAFAQRDAETMAACYAENAQFSDPVFPRLAGAEVGMMWRMLCERGTDLRVEHTILSHTAHTAVVQWDAYYTFSATGRMVHNRVHATMTVKDGRIVQHTDRFGFWRWTRHALGLPGVLLGWTPIVQGKVRSQAAAGLAAYTKKAA